MVLQNKLMAARSLVVAMSLLLSGAASLTMPEPLRAADQTKQQSAAPDWSKGAFIGHVTDTAGKPLADATVALQNKSGKVIAWTKTDAQGQYVLAADTLKELQLRPSRRRGFLEKLSSGVGKVVTAPVKLATGVVKEIDPVKTGKAMVVSAATANPAPLTAQTAATIGTALTDQAKAKTREHVVKSVVGERQATPKQKRESLVPGEVFLCVVAPGFKELKDKAGAYWLEPPVAATSEGKVSATGVRAWLETVKLGAITVADSKSEVENNAILLTNGTVEPGLAVAGSSVKLSVTLTTPGNQPLKVRIFAREDKKRTVVELTPQKDMPLVFTGELTLPADMVPGDTVITLVGLRREPLEVKLKDDKTDPLLEFARGLDDLDPDKAYEFDPRILASENRLELPVTVLDPKKVTAPVASTPPVQSLPSTTPPPPSP